MNPRPSAVFPLALAGMALAGWLFSAPAAAQTTEKPATAKWAAAQQGADADSASADEKESDDVVRRQEWFYRPRRYPLPLIPGGARQQAIQQREASRRELVRRGILAGGSNPNPAVTLNAWTAIGPTPTAANGFDFLDHTVNPTNFSGRINAIAVDPVNNNIVYLGGADGGLWKSTNGGTTWTVLTDAQPSLAIGAIAIDPGSCSSGSCQTIYVGTGEANFAGDNYYGAGVLKSTNGGMTFTQLGANAGSVTLAAGYVPPPNTPAPNSFVGPFDVAVGGSFFSDIVVNPANSSKLLASVRIFENADGGASSGIFCSDDGGMTWLQVVAGAPGTAVVITPDGSTAYGALGNLSGHAQNGIYKTTDASSACSAQSWSLLSSGIPVGTGTGRISLALAQNTPTTLYAAVADPAEGSNDLLDVYKTTNAGSTWAATHAPSNCTPQCWYDMTIKVHPNNANVVLLGGSAVTNSHGSDIYLLRSSTGGSTWDGGTLASEIAFDGSNEIHVDQHAIAFSPPASGAANYTLYVGNDGGAWSTPIGGTGTGTVQWTDLNSTLTLSQFYPGMSIHPSSQLVAIGGLQDNGSQKFDAGTVPGSLIWNQILFADGGYTYINPATPSTVFATTEYLPGSGFYYYISKSVINGDLDSSGRITFSPATYGINSDENSEFIPPLAGDPTPGNDRVMYYGTCHIYQSRDGAANWAAMSSSSLCAGPADYTTIAAAADGNTVYAGDDIGHVHMTTDAISGASAAWADVSAAPLPAATNVSDPTDGRAITKIAVAANNPSFALVSYSGFCGFANISSGVVDNVGHIFETTNGGATWTDISGGCNGPAGQALPNTPVNDIVIDPTDPTNMTIYVATDVGVFFTSNGGGEWLPMDQEPRTLPDGAVLSLTLRNASRTLRAGLHGRGVWDYQLPLTAAQQAYSLVSLTPVFASQGGTSPVSLTLNGNGFTPASAVQFGSASLATTFVSSTQLTATIPAAQLAAAASVPVNVSDPVAGTSDALIFSVVVTSSSPGPLNDAFPGFAISSSTYSDTENTYAATTNTNGITDPLPSCVQNPPSGAAPPANGGAANSIWYNWTAPAAANGAMVEADTVGSSEDTILLVVTGSPGAFTQVACNDDIQAGAFPTSRVIFSAASGTTYYFMISNYEGSSSPNSIGSTVIFNLNATLQPTITSITPNTIQAGTSTAATLTGSNFTAPLSLSLYQNSGGGPVGTFSGVQAVNGSTITATLNLPPNSGTGTDAVILTTNGGQAQSPFFTVTPTVPTLTSISPATGVPGTNVSVNLLGSSFDASTTVNFSGTGITARNFDVAPNGLGLVATFQIASNAPLGPQNVTVTTTLGTTAPVTFTVVGPPTLTSISPTSGAQGTSVPATLTGTNFLNVTAITFSGTGTGFPAGVNVSPDGTSITGTIGISANALLGPQNVAVTANGVTTSSVTFTVTPPTPTLASINPSAATLGAANLGVTLTGTNFVPGSTTINVPHGITVVSATVASSTTTNAVFNIAPTAATGPQLITVSTAGGTSNNVVFSVGTDFMLTANPTSATVTPGTGAATTLTLTPANPNSPFPANVQFSCSGLPNLSSCNFSSTAAGFVGGSTGTLPATDGTTGSTQVTVSFTTTAPSLMAPQIRKPWGPKGAPPLVALEWGSLLAALGVAFFAATRQRRMRLRWALAAILLLAFAGLIGACGGGSSSGIGGGGGGNAGTTPGTYPITVTAMSGTASHSVTYTLMVTQ